MPDDMLFCPACGMPTISVNEVGVITVRHERGHRLIECRVSPTIVCGNCAVISEVNPDTGSLVDLAGGRLTLAHLHYRVNEVDNAPTMAPLQPLRRRDS